MSCEMKKAIEAMNGVISEDDRNLFSVAYKNVVGARRSSWRAMLGIEKKQSHDHEGSKKLELVSSYKAKIEAELTDLCNEVLDILDNYLIKESEKNSDPSSQVFYMKMKGDYLRYLAEIQKESGNTDSVHKAAEVYHEAWLVSQEHLERTHPIHLGLALNYSVYHFEIQDSKEKACELAKKAFDEAILMLDSLNTETYKDSTLIMQLLRDNLTLWSADDGAEEENDDKN